MAKLLNDEYSMCSFTTYKEGKGEKTGTFFTVLLNATFFRGVFGSGSKKFVFTLLKSKGKPITYIRDNEDSSDLATEMAKMIAENEGN